MTKQPELVSSTLEIQDRVALFTMNRDDVRNELTGSGIVDDICNTVSFINNNPDVSVLVITGAGRAFSAGGNIKDMLEEKGIFAGDAASIAEGYRRNIQRVPLAMEQLDVPVIAAVNGPAIGAGCDLTCMCDFRIVSPKAIFGETFLNLGIIPGDGGAWLIQRLIGPQRAAEMAFTGRLVHAEEAVAIGLALRMVDHDQLMAEVMAFANEIASKPPRAVRYTKRLLRQAQNMDMRSFLDLCANYQAMSHKSEDHHEALRAFLEKRPGQYTGR